MPAQAETPFVHPELVARSLGVEPGMVVADFGAGSGHYALEFARLVGGSGRVYAIDVQHDLLRRIKNEAASRGLMNVHTVHADIEREGGTRLADRVVDLALLSNVLFQLEAPESALRESWRVVKPGGRVAVIDWLDSFGGMGPIGKHVLGRARAHELAQDSGFELIRELPAGARHFALVLKPVAFRAGTRLIRI